MVVDIEIRDSNGIMHTATLLPDMDTAVQHVGAFIEHPIRNFLPLSVFYKDHETGNIIEEYHRD